MVGGFLMAVMSACSVSPPAVRVTLTGPIFGTTGGNLFNCSTPDQPANRHDVTPTTIACEPNHNPDGTFTTTPVTVTQEVGCGDGHGAYVFVSCQGTGTGREVSGTVGIALTDSCSDATTATNEQSFAFQNMGPGETQTSAELDSCSVFGNLCGTSSPCSFNSFASSISVSNTSPVGP
jgi:hypothetical protein